jgi:hypothetical protein
LFFLGGTLTLSYIGLLTILNPKLITIEFVLGSWFVLVMLSMASAIWVISIALKAEKRLKNEQRKTTGKPK